MASPLQIVIVGAGIGGLACAIASRKQGLEVLVLEKAGRLTPLGAGIQIPPNASRIWAHYGILDRLKEHAVVSKAVIMKRWETGELLCTRSIDKELIENWPWLTIHRADYQRLLVQEAIRLGVKLRLGADVQDVDFDNTTVTLQSGEVIASDVVIGADGLWSSLRSHILGYESPPQETGDQAYRGTFSLNSLLSLDDPDVDELCRQNIITLWVGPNRHAVFYPVRNGNDFNLVLISPDNLLPGVKTEEGDIEAMLKEFEGWDPLLSTILTAFDSVLRWKMLHHDELSSWTKGNVALLGDACHPSLPYQAQGAAMAVEDGAILGTLLGLHQEARSGPTTYRTLPETLKLYESLQKARTTTMHLGSISNQHLYHLPDGPEQEDRDRILKQAQWTEKEEGESEPFIWIDVRYQNTVLYRDAIGDAKKKWEDKL